MRVFQSDHRIPRTNRGGEVGTPAVFQEGKSVRTTRQLLPADSHFSSCHGRECHVTTPSLLVNLADETNERSLGLHSHRLEAFQKF